MQAKWGNEVQELVTGEDFMTWFRQYNVLRDNMRATQERLDTLRMEAAQLVLKADAVQHRADNYVYSAGELDDKAMMAQAEYANIENSSFEMVSAFETERRRATEAWQLHDRMEKVVEDHRQRLSEGKARIEAARRSGTPEGHSEADRLQSRMRELEQTLKDVLRDAQQAKVRLDRLTEQKNRLWGGVEESWSRMFRAAMAQSEYGYRARRARADGEEYFALAATERRRADNLAEESRIAEQQIAALKREYDQHLERCRSQFECVLIEEFLYWPQQGNVAMAWVVPLLDEVRHLNLQLSALQVYQVERNRGLELVEPVAEALEGPHDVRLDAFFLPHKPASSKSSPQEER